MADVKISELTALTSPDGAEELVVNDGGTTKKITITNATSAKAPIASPVFTGTVNAPTVSASVRLDTDLIKSKSNTPLSFQLSDGTAVGSFSNTTGALVTNLGLDSSQKIVSGKTAGQYGSVAEFKAEGSGVKLRIDDNSNASATTRMHIMHNYNRDSGNETCDSSSVGQAAIKFDNGSITFATAAAGNTTAPTNRMSIDNAGRVTMPYQAGFYARRSVGGDNRASHSQEWAISGTGSRNTGNHFVTSNGRFTAPVDGVYSFAATPAYKQSNINLNWYFRVNGSVVSEPVRLIGSLNTHSTVSGSTIIKLNASDYVDIDIDNLHHANTTYNYFCGHLLS